MQSKKRQPDAVTEEELAYTLAVQQAEKDEKDATELQERTAPLEGAAFPRMSKAEMP